MPQFPVKPWWFSTLGVVGEMYVKIVFWLQNCENDIGQSSTNNAGELPRIPGHWAIFPGTILSLGREDLNQEKKKRLWNLISSKRWASAKRWNTVSLLYGWELRFAHLLHCPDVTANDNEKWHLVSCVKHQTIFYFFLKLSIDPVKVSTRKYYMQITVKLEVKEVWSLMLAEIFLWKISINCL